MRGTGYILLIDMVESRTIQYIQEWVIQIHLKIEVQVIMK